MFYTLHCYITKMYFLSLISYFNFKLLKIDNLSDIFFGAFLLTSYQFEVRKVYLIQQEKEGKHVRFYTFWRKAKDLVIFLWNISCYPWRKNILWYWEVQPETLEQRVKFDKRFRIGGDNLRRWNWKY